jgi:hypothetical protein
MAALQRDLAVAGNATRVEVRNALDALQVRLTGNREAQASTDFFAKNAKLLGQPYGLFTLTSCMGII